MRKLEDEGEEIQKIHKFWKKKASYFLCIILKTLPISEFTYKQPPVLKQNGIVVMVVVKVSRSISIQFIQILEQKTTLLKHRGK